MINMITRRIRLAQFSLIFGACFVLLQGANAQPSAVSSSSLRLSEVSEASRFSPSLGVQIRALNYLTDSEVDEKSQGQAEIYFGLKKDGFIFAELQGSVGSYTQAGSVYFPFPEAYVAVGNEKTNFIAVGIKKQSLSFVDRYYHLGMFESYFTNDFIDYKQQGLAGVQFQLHKDYFGFKGGYQPLFLKNQGPEVHETEGTISSSNRWAKRPPERFEFVEGQNRRIQYQIRDYKVMDIINNQGYTASVFVGRDADRPVLQASFAHHPLNEIPLTRETYGSLSDFTGHVYLSPVVTNHEVASMDMNLDRGIFQSTFSYLQDRPLNSNPLVDETLQVLDPVKVYSIYLSLNLKDFLSRSFLISVAAAEIQGGEIKDLTLSGQESVFTFSANRSVFKKPLALGLTGEAFFLTAKPVMTSVSWTYDRELKGSLVSAKVSHETFPKLFFQAGFDLLGVENELPPDAMENFLSQNQANDRYFVGAQYVF